MRQHQQESVVRRLLRRLTRNEDKVQPLTKDTQHSVASQSQLQTQPQQTQTTALSTKNAAVNSVKSTLTVGTQTHESFPPSFSETQSPIELEELAEVISTEGNDQQENKIDFETPRDDNSQTMISVQEEENVTRQETIAAKRTVQISRIPAVAMFPSIVQNSARSSRSYRRCMACDDRHNHCQTP